MPSWPNRKRKASLLVQPGEGEDPHDAPMPIDYFGAVGSPKVRCGSEAAEPLPAASVRFGQCLRGSRQSAYGQPFPSAPIPAAKADISAV
jgi:hypothetical protein